VLLTLSSTNIISNSVILILIVIMIVLVIVLVIVILLMHLRTVTSLCLQYY